MMISDELSLSYQDGFWLYYY